jgi:hypothetical protein
VKRMLMFLYLVLVMMEKEQQTQRRGWRRFMRRTRRPDTYLSFAESGVTGLPRTDRLSGPMMTQRGTESNHETNRDPSLGESKKAMSQTGGTPEPKHKAVVEVIPKTLVDHEAECAIRLQMPNRTTPQAIRAFGNDRYDTPIGRTLTRERMLRDWRHVPRVAISHLPVDDVSRLVAKGVITTPQPTSPKRRGTEKKGKPTPKRPRRGHE